MEYPFVSVSAYDVTDPDKRASVELHFGSEFTISGVTEQDAVDAVKDALGAAANVTVSAHRYEVTSSTV